MEVIVTIVSKLVYNLFRGLANCLYRGYNPFTKYHGHPSGKMCFFFCRTELLGFKNVNRSNKTAAPHLGEINHKLNLSCGFLVFQPLLGRKKDRKKDTPSKNHWEKKNKVRDPGEAILFGETQ